MEFCKAFNAQTQKMEKGIPIPVVITTYQRQLLHLRDEDAAGVVLLEEGGQAESGLQDPRARSVGKVTKAQVREIAEQKMKDLNANDVDAAMKMIEGSARSMGLTVE